MGNEKKLKRPRELLLFRVPPFDFPETEDPPVDFFFDEALERFPCDFSASEELRPPFAAAFLDGAILPPPALLRFPERRRRAPPFSSSSASSASSFRLPTARFVSLSSASYSSSSVSSSNSATCPRFNCLA